MTDTERRVAAAEEEMRRLWEQLADHRRQRLEMEASIYAEIARRNLSAKDLAIGLLPLAACLVLIAALFVLVFQ